MEIELFPSQWRGTGKYDLHDTAEDIVTSLQNSSDIGFTSNLMLHMALTTTTVLRN
tara:strand:- start:594 stop:761 length:168 start_codon:yes stop_codon:yes gene_type:complete